MNHAVLADAGPLYAVVDPDDSQHRRAVREMERLDEERREIVVAYSTLLETSNSLILFRLGEELRQQTGSSTLPDALFDQSKPGRLSPGRRQAPRISRPAHHPF